MDEDQKMETKLMRVVATLFVLAFCLLMFIKFLFY